MIHKFPAILILTLTAILNAAAFSQNTQDDWNDFLHYTAVGRFELAAGFAQKLIDSKPEPLTLLKLSEENPRGYAILLKVYADNPQLAPLAGKILEIIEQGRFARRTDTEIITQEIKRLSSTVRGKYTAIERLRNSGEYAIPFMLDALADGQRIDEFVHISTALPEMGAAAVRPLTAALVMDNPVVKAEVIKALGKIGYPESLGYLKYIVEKEPSKQLVQLASESINQIDSSAAEKKAADLFFSLAEKYYYKAPSLAPPADVNFANIWFWEKDGARLVREEVSQKYFYELMTMRVCEWAIRADADCSDAIALWLAAFFRAENTALAYPRYFGTGHADAMTYGSTAGAEYLHKTLARAVKDKDAAVALGAVEALNKNGGEKSLLYQLKTSQPLLDALSFSDRAVRLSAAIALAAAKPTENFKESPLAVNNLIEAVSAKADANWPQETADSYAIRSCDAMLKLASSKNTAIDISTALSAIIEFTKDGREEIRIFASEILSHLASPDAQRAIAQAALNEENNITVRLAAFDSLAASAKINGCLLLDEQIEKIYQMVLSTEIDSQLRGSASAAYGAMNLPSRKVRDLILHQAKT